MTDLLCGDDVALTDLLTWHSPRALGGLGLRSIESITDVAIQRQTWNIASKRKSIWTNSVFSKLLRGKSFWAINTPTERSWGWRGILSARPKVLAQAFHLIGNGKQTNFWHNSWLPGGRLIDRFGAIAIYDLGGGDDITVSSFIDNGDWCPP